MRIHDLMAAAGLAMGVAAHAQSGAGVRLGDDRGGTVLEWFDQPYRPWSPPASTIVTQAAFPGLIQVNVNPSRMNIVGDAANEPSIAIDPTAPLRMTIGWRQFDTIASNFRQGGFAHSLDGGRTWTPVNRLSPGTFLSDPVLECDRNGRLYFNALNVEGNAFTPRLYRAAAVGGPFDAPFVVPGGDKIWMAIDQRAGQGGGNIYSAWNTAGNAFFPRTFARSIDRGVTWSNPIELPGRPVFGTVAVGPDGEVYVAGVPNSTNTPTFTVVRSNNARDPLANPVTFSPAVTVNLGGNFRLGAAPNPQGLLGQVWIAVDNSNGPRRGWVYLLSSADPAGNDPMDVFLARSTNGGATWSAPVRVNTDLQVANAWQWMGTLSVSPDGRLDVVWNDTRASLNPVLSRTYYRSSSDGGVTWGPEQIITAQWDSTVGFPQQNKIGDYYHMRSDRLGASLAFATTLNGEQDVYFARIGPEDCNGNAVDDAAEIAAGSATDCNGDGIPDACQIVAGTLCDGNANGIADACERPACLIDFNADCALNQEDLSGFLTAFLTDPPQPGPSGTSAAPCPGQPAPFDAFGYAADFNRDCSFNQEDLSGFITEYLTQIESANACFPG